MPTVIPGTRPLNAAQDEHYVPDSQILYDHPQGSNEVYWYEKMDCEGEYNAIYEGDLEEGVYDPSKLSSQNQRCISKTKYRFAAEHQPTNENHTEYHYLYARLLHNHTITMTEQGPGAVYVFGSDQVQTKIIGLEQGMVGTAKWLSRSLLNWVVIGVKIAMFVGVLYGIF